jgi:hypothetical protein
MHIVMVHWRIKPDEESVQAFLRHWREENRVDDRSGLVAEFLSESLPPKNLPDTTWYLDSESLGDHRSFVNVAIWRDAKDFQEQIAKHYNDKRPMLAFEKYRRRRVVAESNNWRIGNFRYLGRLPRRPLIPRCSCAAHRPFVQGGVIVAGREREPGASVSPCYQRRSTVSEPVTLDVYFERALREIRPLAVTSESNGPAP